MIRDTLKNLQHKTNANMILGFPPGILYCVMTIPGGGFAGASQKIEVVQLKDGPNEFERVEFPPPSVSVEYHIGGRVWGNNNYHTFPDGRVEVINQV
jgi:hypothetical protein